MKFDSRIFRHCILISSDHLLKKDRYVLALTLVSAFHGLFFVQSAVDKIIERMDEYFLSKEEWDTIVELGVGDKKDELILKKIPAPTKAAFTKKCTFPQLTYPV
jgi:hypothetical protein